MGYKAGNIDLKVGKQEISSFFTDKEKATGISLSNSDVSGLTFKTYYMDSLESENDNDDLFKLNLRGKDVSQRNVVGLSAQADCDFINVGLHYINVQDLTSLYSADVLSHIDFSKDMNLELHVQYAHSKLQHKDALKQMGWDNGNLYLAEITSNLSAFDVAVGYANWSTKNNSKSFVVLDDKDDCTDAGKQYTFDYNGFSGKNASAWVKLGYTIDQVRIGGEYVRGYKKNGVNTFDNGVDIMQVGKTKYDEKLAKVTYKYSKNLKLETLYSRMVTKNAGTKDKCDQIRLEAKYTF